MAGKVTNQGERHILQTAAGGMAGLNVHLAKAPFVESDNQVIGDFVEADYDGYAPEPLLFSGLAVGNPGGRAIAIYTPVLFLCSGATTPNNIYGYWVSGPGGIIIIVERFAGVPRPMVALGNTVGADITLRLWCPV